MIIKLIAAVVFLLLAYYFYFLLQILKGLRKLISLNYHQSHESVPEELITLIIPFRNESENILNSLASIINLEYPKEKLEVIFVNDFSDDNSLDLLCKAEKPVNIRLLSVPDNYSKFQHKKRAIRYGIENSSGEIIVTTDADCVHSSIWLKT